MNELKVFDMKEMTIDEIRQVQISLLDAIDAFCKQNNINYYLHAGTLIGAVRHQGYIPWDDDIDVCMLREDYEKFFNNFIDNTNHYKAICFENTRDYYLAFGKLIDERTIMYESTSHGVPIGVYVDIFPMDSLPDDDSMIKELNSRINKYRKALILKNLALVKERKWYKNLIISIGRVFLKPISVSYLLNKISRLAQTYRSYENCNKVAGISVLTYGLKEVHYLEEYENTVELLFEGKKYPAPCGYDKILSRMYGDYMKLPSEEQRVSHHLYKAYWK